MRPPLVAAAFVALVGGIVALGLHFSPRQVRLPEFPGTVSFFQEDRQGIRLASLPKGIQSLSAENCGSCHAKEYEEWAHSSHAGASTEPVFAAAFEAEQRTVCRSCHSPLLEQHPILLTRGDAPTSLLHGRRVRLATSIAVPQPPRVSAVQNPSYSVQLSREGVNCASCHVRDGTVLTGNRFAAADVPHPLHYTPALKTAEFCGGCHQFDIARPDDHPVESDFGPDGLIDLKRFHKRQVAALNLRRPDRARAALLLPEDPPIPADPTLEGQYQREPRVQHTLEEFRLSPAAARGDNCQSCHMKTVTTARGRGPTHAWPGRHSREMLRSAVRLEARLDQSPLQVGGRLQAVIRLGNDSGHRFPTGDSIHSGILDVWLRADQGKTTLSRLYHVLQERPSFQLFAQRADELAFVSGEGSSFVPARQVAGSGELDAPNRKDTRLLPGEQQTILFRRNVDRGLARSRDAELVVRLYHAAMHPGFRGSRIDSGQRTLTLVREVVLPVGRRP